MDYWGLLTIIISVLVTIGAIIQGIDATFNLINRWKAWRKSKKASKETPSDGRRFRLRLTQRLLKLIPWYLLIAAEINPLYVYFSHFIDAGNMMFAMISYILTLLSFPIWMDVSEETQSRKYLRFSIYFICLELFLANLVYFGAIKVQGSFPSGFIAFLHVIGFSGYRYSMLLYVISRLRPLFYSLPER